MKYYPSTKSREETEDWIDRNIRSYRDHGFGLWAVTDKNTGAFLGQCGLVLQRDVDGRDEVEIGYAILRERWNAGYATEAAVACRDLGFSRLGLSRLVSLIHPENRSSIRVAEKVGMRREKEIERWGKRLLVYGLERGSGG